MGIVSLGEVLESFESGFSALVRVLLIFTVAFSAACSSGGAGFAGHSVASVTGSADCVVVESELGSKDGVELVD
jgi:hypothetical protein